MTAVKKSACKSCEQASEAELLARLDALSREVAALRPQPALNPEG